MSYNINNLIATQPTGYYANVKSFEDKASLGKDDFLKILVTQLKNQDPTKPLEDREYIAQMSQFSALEQMSNLNQSMTKFVEMSTGNQLSQQAHLIGKAIEWQQNDNNNILNGNGKVVSLSVKNGEVFAKLDNDQQIPVKDIMTITESQSSTGA